MIFVGLPQSPFSVIKGIKKKAGSQVEFLLPSNSLSAQLSVGSCTEDVMQTAYDDAKNFNPAKSGLNVFKARLAKEYQNASKNFNGLAFKTLTESGISSVASKTCLVPLKISVDSKLSMDIPNADLLNVSLGSESLFCSKGKAYLNKDSGFYQVKSSLESYAKLINDKKAVSALKKQLADLQTKKASLKNSKQREKIDKQIRKISLSISYAKYFSKDSLLLASFYDSVCAQSAFAATPNAGPVEPTAIPAASATAVPTVTAINTATIQLTATFTATNTPTRTFTITPSRTPTFIVTYTATYTPTKTTTVTPTKTLTATATNTVTPTRTSTFTATSVPQVDGPPSAPSITAPQSGELPAGTSQVTIEWGRVLNSSGKERYLVRGINTSNNANILSTSINRDAYTQRSITISGLTAGSYRFWVHAANDNYPADNSYSNPPADFYFNIASGGGMTPIPGTVLKIMPLGDSITQGTDTRNATPPGVGGGYRLPLGNLLSSAGSAYDFVGDSRLNSVAGADPDHNGYPGRRTDEILNSLPTLLANNPPDVVLLHIGTNDIMQGRTVSSAVSNLEKIIQGVIANAPNRKLYVAKIIPFAVSQYVSESQANTWNAKAESYNQEVQRLATQYNVNMVDMYAPGINGNTSKSIITAEANDGIHPGDQGNAEMARRWYNAFLRIVAPTPTPTASPTVGNFPPATGTRIVIGSAERIMESFDSNGPTYDLSAPTLRKSATEFYTWWQNGSYSFKKFEGTLNNPFATQLWKVSGSSNSHWNSNGFPKEPKAGEKDYAHRPWMGNIYKHTDSQGTILIGLVHIETDIYNVTTCRYRQGIAVSTDNGDTWKYLGDVIKPKFEQSDRYSNLAGAPLLIVGDYLYQYFNEYPSVNQPRIPAVARAKISDVIAAARSGTVSEWVKYNKNLGGWTQNGLTGLGSNILPGTDRYDMHTDAVYSPALGKYLLVAWEQTGWDYSDPNFPIYPSHRGYYLYTSTDGVNWKDRQKLYTPQLANEENPYPFFAGGLDHAQTRDDFNVIGGNKFYLFFPDRINHKFYRVPINIE